MATELKSRFIGQESMNSTQPALCVLDWVLCGNIDKCSKHIMISSLPPCPCSTNYKWKSARRDANTAHALAVVRCGHRPPARCYKLTDRSDYNTLCRS